MEEFDIEYIHIENICTQSIPNKTGVYIINHSYDNIHAEKYVGSSKNICKRISDHNDKKIISIDLFITNDINLAKKLEKLLIELIKPLTNKSMPYIIPDKNLMNKLLENDEIYEIIEKLSNDSIKIGYRFLTYNNDTNKSMKNTSRLNIYIPDKYLDVLNIIKITNKGEIENLFKAESTQSSTLQLLVLEFVKVRNMKDFEKMLDII